MSKPNCCNNLQEVISWFKDLKADGVSKEDVFDAIEFDSDQYPNRDNLEKAREIVYE